MRLGDLHEHGPWYVKDLLLMHIDTERKCMATGVLIYLSTSSVQHTVTLTLSYYSAALTFPGHA